MKGGANEKRLASQFITRFFKYFPDLQPLAIEALFDLCEDDDVNVSKFKFKFCIDYILIHTLSYVYINVMIYI